MKTIHFKQALFCALFLSFLSCVQEQSITPISSENKLTVETARFYYEKALKRVETKASSGSERTNLFYREAYKENWGKAILSQTGLVESVDVPVDEPRHYYVISRDGSGYYLTRCHHSLSIVRSVETGAIGVYHHFFIPFRRTNDAFKGAYDGHLYGNFRNNGFREDFTGLELYSDTEGNIVKFLRYYRGKQYEDRYYGNGSLTREMIAYQVRYYITKAYGIKAGMKTKSDHTGYLCPDCGFDLREAESGYLYCHNCSWSELDFYDQEIDECIFYGEGGNGSSGSGDGGFPDPDFPQQPDPNIGGSGGSYGDGGGPGIPQTFNLDATADQRIAPVLNQFMEDCGGSSIILALSEFDVSFRETKGLLNVAEMHPIIVYRRDSETQEIIDTHYKYRIDYNLEAISQGTLICAIFEELFHCFQHINYGTFSNEWKLNVEIEAKYATYLYMDKHGRFDEVPGTDVEKQCFVDYRSDPSDYNYARIVDYVRSLGPTYMGMSEDSSHRSMPELFVFNCYENE